MKTSTKKTLFLIGGIVLLIHLFSTVITYFAVLSSPDIIAYVASLYNISYAQYTQIYNAIIVVFTIIQVINVILTIVASVIFFKKSKYSEKEFEDNKTSNLVWSIVILIFVSFIAGILGVIASVVSSEPEKAKEEKITPTVNEEKIIDEKPTSNASNEPSELLAQIAKLKKLKTDGVITEEEYEKLFSNLIK